MESTTPSLQTPVGTTSEVSTVQNTALPPARGSEKLTLEGGTSITPVPSSADPQRTLKFDIRAESAKAKELLDIRILFEGYKRDDHQNALKAIKEVPFYNFIQRSKLRTASLKAQLKFDLYTGKKQLKQTQVDYLEALSKSSLPADKQYEKYAAFQTAVENADNANYHSYVLEEVLVGASSKTKKFYTSDLQQRKTAAAQAEQQVQKLLKEIQQSHTEFRDKVDELLAYCKEEQRHVTDKTSEEAKTLKEEIKVIEEFKTGGMTSLPIGETTKFNELFKEASKKYQTYQREELKKEETSTSTASSDSLETAKEAFKAAHAAEMAEIKRLQHQSSLLGLRKELENYLEHIEAFQSTPATAASGSASTSNDKITTLKEFLNSLQLNSFRPEQTAELMDLCQKANQKHDDWNRSRVNTKALEADLDSAKAAVADATAAVAASIPSRRAAMASAQTREEKTLEEARNQKNAAQKAVDDDSKAVDGVKKDLEKTDQEIINKIKSFLPQGPTREEESESLKNEETVSSAPTSNQTAPDSYPPTPERAPTRLSDDFISQNPLPEDEELDLLNTTRAQSVAAPPTTQEQVNALRQFAEKLQESVNHRISRQQGDPQLLQQQASLQRFLDLDEAALGKLPAEKISPLVTLMREIEEKNAERKTASVERLLTLPAEIELLEIKFISSLF